MFEKLLGDDKAEITEAQWTRIRDLLVRLADDPDPDLESDRPKEGWFGNNDPITVAINHVRSEAILSLIFYAQKASVETEKKLGKKADEMEPVVRNVLNTKVNRRNDFSLAVHSVFGGQLNRLFWIDRKWVENHLDDIFPTDDV